MSLDKIFGYEPIDLSSYFFITHERLITWLNDEGHINSYRIQPGDEIKYNIGVNPLNQTFYLAEVFLENNRFNIKNIQTVVNGVEVAEFSETTEYRKGDLAFYKNVLYIKITDTPGTIENSWKKFT